MHNKCIEKQPSYPREKFTYVRAVDVSTVVIEMIILLAHIPRLLYITIHMSTRLTDAVEKW